MSSPATGNKAAYRKLQGPGVLRPGERSRFSKASVLEKWFLPCPARGQKLAYRVLALDVANVQKRFIPSVTPPTFHPRKLRQRFSIWHEMIGMRRL